MEWSEAVEPEPQEPASGTPWSPIESITFAFEKVKEDPAGLLLPLIAITLIEATPSIVGPVLSTIAEVILGDDGGTIVGYAISALMTLIGLVLGSYCMAGSLVFALRAVRGEAYAFADVFTGTPYLVPMFVLQLITNAVTSFGLLLCIVPGVIFWLGVVLAGPLLVDRNVGPIQALKESWAFTDGHRVNLLVLSLIGCGLVLVGFSACCVGVLAVIPVLMLTWAHVYLRLTKY